MPYHVVIGNRRGRALNRRVSRRGAVNDAVSSILIETAGSDDVGFVKYPVKAERKSYLNGRSADVSAQAVAGTVFSQSMFLPIALFVVIVFAAQMTAASMATEKSDKTFETLLSMPISRTTILMAKMLSVGIMGVIYAAVYLLGFSFIMGGGTGIAGMGGGVPAEALSALGLTLGVGQYLIIGINVLFSIMIALSLAIIVGVASKDVKAAQGGDRAADVYRDDTVYHFAGGGYQYAAWRFKGYRLSDSLLPHVFRDIQYLYGKRADDRDRDRIPGRYAGGHHYTGSENIQFG